jgi:hypothetical protein
MFCHSPHPIFLSEANRQRPNLYIVALAGALSLLNNILNLRSRYLNGAYLSFPTEDSVLNEVSTVRYPVVLYGCEAATGARACTYNLRDENSGALALVVLR